MPLRKQKKACAARCESSARTKPVTEEQGATPIGKAPARDAHRGHDTTKDAKGRRSSFARAGTTLGGEVTYRRQAAGDAGERLGHEAGSNAMA